MPTGRHSIPENADNNAASRITERSFRQSLKYMDFICLEKSKMEVFTLSQFTTWKHELSIYDNNLIRLEHGLAASLPSPIESTG